MGTFVKPNFSAYKMGAMRTIAIVLGLGAVCLTVYSTLTPFWAENIVNSGTIQMDKKAIGLWKYCQAVGGAASYNCQPLSQYGIVNLASTGIVGQRALMVIGVLCGIGGFFAGVTSTDAVNVAKSSGDKNKAAGGAAGAFLGAGLCVLAATAWAASKIVKRYQSMSWGGNMNINAGTQWTLGAGIYCGWVAAAIYIGIAIIMFCGCCGGSDKDDYDEDYNQGYNQGPAHPYAESGYSQGKKEFV